MLVGYSFSCVRARGARHARILDQLCHRGRWPSPRLHHHQPCGRRENSAEPGARAAVDRDVQYRVDTCTVAAVPYIRSRAVRTQPCRTYLRPYIAKAIRSCGAGQLGPGVTTARAPHTHQPRAFRTCQGTARQTWRASPSPDPDPRQVRRLTPAVALTLALARRVDLAPAPAPAPTPAPALAVAQVAHDGKCAQDAPDLRCRGSRRAAARAAARHGA